MALLQTNKKHNVQLITKLGPRQVQGESESSYQSAIYPCQASNLAKSDLLCLTVTYGRMINSTTAQTILRYTLLNKLKFSEQVGFGIWRETLNKLWRGFQSSVVKPQPK